MLFWKCNDIPENLAYSRNPASKKKFLTPFALQRQKQIPGKAHKYKLFRGFNFYSNSIVAGGFPVMS